MSDIKNQPEKYTRVSRERLIGILYGAGLGVIMGISAARVFPPWALLLIVLAGGVCFTLSFAIDPRLRKKKARPAENSKERQEENSEKAEK